MVTISDVESWDSKSWNALDSTQKQDLVDRAERYVDDILTKRTSTVSTIEGALDDLKTLIAAHFWTLAEGGEAQSESATGGSVNYNTVTGEVYNGLSETRYGRMALEYIGDEQSTGIVRSY